jgi:hypothetical protein
MTPSLPGLRRGRSWPVGSHDGGPGRCRYGELSWSLIHALRDLCLEIGSERLGDSFPRRFIGNLLGSLGATHRGFLYTLHPAYP